MSMFIGKSIVDTPLIHITTGSHTIAELNSGPISDTVFHSDLNMFFIIQTRTWVHTTSNKYVTTDDITTYNASLALSVIKFSSGSILTCFGAAGASPGNNVMSYDEDPSNSFRASSGGYSGGVALPTDTIFVTNNTGEFTTVTSIEQFIFGTSIADDAGAYFYSQKKTSSSILISSSSLVIGGVNFLEYPIISFVPNPLGIPDVVPFPVAPSPNIFQPIGVLHGSSGLVDSGSVYAKIISKNPSGLRLEADSVSQSILSGTNTLFSSEYKLVSTLVEKTSYTTQALAQTVYTNYTEIGAVSIGWYSDSARIAMSFRVTLDLYGVPSAPTHVENRKFYFNFVVIPSSYSSIFTIWGYDAFFNPYQKVDIAITYVSGILRFYVKTHPNNAIANLRLYTKMYKMF